MVEMELDLPWGRRFVEAWCLWSGTDWGYGGSGSISGCVLCIDAFGRDGTRPSGGRGAVVCWWFGVWSLGFVMWCEFGLWKVGFHPGQRFIC